MKFSFSKKVLAVVVLILIAVISVDGILFGLLSDKIINIKDKTRQLNTSIEERERDLNLRDSIEDSRIDREKLISFFVPAGDAATVSFISKLEDLARNNKLIPTVRNVSYEENFIRIKLSTAGTWADIEKFLASLEGLPVVISIANFILQSDGEGKNWSGEFDLLVGKIKDF